MIPQNIPFFTRYPLCYLLVGIILLASGVSSCDGSLSSTKNPAPQYNPNNAHTTTSENLGNNTLKNTSPNTPQENLHQTGLTILFLGDSLTEGYNLSPAESYPSLVEQAFTRTGSNVTILNGGISGDTTLGGLNRFKWYLSNQTYAIDVLFLALGANDGLRGLPITTTKKNLHAIITLAQTHNIKVVLAGMLIPPNYGRAYAENFRLIYDELQLQFNLVRMTFLLQDVAGEPELNMADGIHPNAKGYAIIAQNVYNVLKPIITKLDDPSS